MSSVEVPAGAGQVDLAVTPIADQIEEPGKFVTISLVSANGAAIDPLAESATVFLLDTESLVLRGLSALAGIPGRGAILEVKSFGGATVEVEATSDFLTWQPAFTVSDPHGQIKVTDPAAPDFATRFYRVQAGAN